MPIRMVRNIRATRGSVRAAASQGRRMMTPQAPPVTYCSISHASGPTARATTKSVLVPVFNAGALRGDTAEQAYYVRCDGSNNPPETIAVGQVLCEVGVAVAAPAEFIVFRVGRREAVVEVLE